MRAQGGFGDNLPCQFHNTIIPAQPPADKATVVGHTEIRALYSGVKLSVMGYPACAVDCAVGTVQNLLDKERTGE